MKIVLFIFLLFISPETSQAQISRDDALDASGNSRNQQNMGNPGEELRYRAAVKHEEESHREMVERAVEIEEIGADLLKSYDQRKSFSREDLKRLERMEKLARKIRGKAGGSDAQTSTETPPAQLTAALTRLAELAEQLNESVKKTSRLVVSATVIERSNELIELIKVIKSFGRT